MSSAAQPTPTPQPSSAVSPRYQVPQSATLWWGRLVPLPHPGQWTPTPQEQAIFNKTCERSESFAIAGLATATALFLCNLRAFYSRPHPFLRAMVGWSLFGSLPQCVPGWQGYQELERLPVQQSHLKQQGYRFPHFMTAVWFSRRSGDPGETVARRG